MESDNKQLAEKVKKLFAHFLGVDIDDIKDEYSLSDDLHMAPSDITDFIEALKIDGVDTSNLNMPEIDTFEEFMESLTDQS